MKTLHAFLILLFVAFCFCGKKRTIECTSDPLRVVLSYFTASQADTIFIREFSNDPAFKDTLSTRLVQLTAENIKSSGFILAELPVGTTWEFDIPGVKKKYRITNIKAEGKTTAITRDKDATCINAVLSYNLNGKETFGPVLGLMP